MDKDSRKAPRSIFGKAQIIGIVVLSVIVVGLVIDSTRADGDDFYADIIRLENVANKIHQDYVKEMSSKDLVDNAIQGMLSILDPHTNYFESKQYEELRIHTEGKFGGLGIQISIRDKTLTVMTPIAGTPAVRAGIQSGDQIIKIEGKPTAGISIDDAVGKLRGEPGTKVTITIRRKGEARDLDYTITREIIHIKSVPYYGVIGNDIGYVCLTQFSQDAGSETEKAVRELLKKNIKGLVFDLRYNPGGLLPQAKEVAEKFLPQNSLVVSTLGRMRDQNNKLISNEPPVLPLDMPLAVLVNYASASASEIVAGAIQDWDRGVIVGDTTFGKGSVQSIIELDKTHHLKMTTAFYYTPSGRCINKPENGVKGSTLNLESDDDDSPADSAATAIIDSAKAQKEKADTTVFKTKAGRPVYGGGGIVPDTIVKQKIPNFAVRSLFGKDAFFQFANIEYIRLKKQNEKIDRNFTVSPAVLKDFYQYLDSIKFTYESLAQIKFKDFEQKTGLKADSADSLHKDLNYDKPSWSPQEFGELEKVSQQMETLLAGESKREISENEPEIKKYLREAILVREFGQDDDAIYKDRLGEDPQLKVAIDLLLNKKEYSLLLKPHAAAPVGTARNTTKK